MFGNAEECSIIIHLIYVYKFLEGDICLCVCFATYSFLFPLLLPLFLSFAGHILFYTSTN